VKERERELETARLELRAAEYARDMLEHRLEVVLNTAPRESPQRGEEVLEVQCRRPSEGPRGHVDTQGHQSPKR
jgi:hypothetical protein